MMIKKRFSRGLQFVSLMMVIALLVSGCGNSAAKETQAAETAGVETEAECVESDGLVSDETEAGFHYEHDPRENPKAMADIIENPEAIYGFSPDPESTRLGEYAAYDWTDPEMVAEAKRKRSEYEKSIESMLEILREMRSAGNSIEEMARAISAERNRVRIASYEGDEEGLAKLRKSNLETYGNEDGPTPEFLYEKYGSWEEVIQHSFSMNMGMDACCGLYDEHYSLYEELGLVETERELSLEDYGAFGEMYLIDSKDFQVQVTDISLDEDGVYEWQLHLVNHSDMDVIMTIAEEAINGVMVDSNWSWNVEADSETDAFVYWTGMKAYGIDVPTLIEGTLELCDTSWHTISRTKYALAPYGQDAVKLAERAGQDEDVVVFENDWLTVTKTFGGEDYGNLLLDFYIENKSDRNIRVSFNPCIIDGSQFEITSGQKVNAGRAAYFSLVIDQEALAAEHLNADEVEKLTGKLVVVDYESGVDGFTEMVIMEVK